MRELRAAVRGPFDDVEGLTWSPDGQYILAVTRSWRVTEGVAIFDVKTGRQRGSFDGCVGEVNGVAVLPDKRQLVAGCADGRIRFWDLDGAVKEIKELVASFHR